MNPTPSITRLAHAKVNLALSVGPPLPAGAPSAGYHPIASWMACIDLVDELTLTRLPASTPSDYSITFAPDAPRPSSVHWPAEKDLAVRAHRLLEATVGGLLPLSLALRKRIPVGGGLGGGSSDAATTLVGVRDLFRLDFTNQQLASLSSKLGSDIAFFIDDDQPAAPALVSGLGDQLERFPRLRMPILLIVPQVGCPTGPVYKAYDKSPVQLRAAEVRGLITRAANEQKEPGDARLDSRALFNDLAAPACLVQPQLQSCIDRIRNLTPLPVHVTGSGSTLFILPGSDSQSHELARAHLAIKLELPELVVVMTRTV